MKAEDGRATSRDGGEGWEEVMGLGLKDMSRNRRDSRFTWKVLAQTEVCARGTVAEGRVGAAAERVPGRVCASRRLRREKSDTQDG